MLDFSKGNWARALPGYWKQGKYRGSFFFFNSIVMRIKENHLKIYKSLTRKMKYSDVFIND